jgi:hypothetical protein
MTQPDPQQQPEPVADPQLTPLEKAFYALVLAALTVWLARVAGKVLTPWRLWKMMPDPQALWSVAPDWNRVVDTNFIPWLRQRAVRAGWDKLDREHPNWRVPGFIDTDAYVQAHLAQVRNLLVRIPQEVFQLIKAELAAGVRDGDSIEAIAANVERVLNVTGSENWPARARVIGITEVNGAANAGWFAAAQRTQEDMNTSLDKVWLSAHDDRVRETHQHANNQRVPLNQPFLVGGFPLLYPGDKAGPPEEVINCRCTAVTEKR